MPLPTGIVLNHRYRIVRLLGQGGFGAVYRAWDLNLDRPCAVKENLDTTEEASRQFKREAKMLADLNHPNLPNVIDHFFIPGQGQYLVMDFVQGEDLQKMLDNQPGQPLSAGKVLGWIDQVCDALSYLHEQNPPIIHRDIKPANIRITPEGKAMLVDFGIAKVFTPGLRTVTGAQAYTPGYASPEQQGGKGTDARSDVYSLGATTYSLLTGLVPPSATDIISGLESSPAPVDRLNPDVTTIVGRAITAAMQLNRDQRLSSVAVFRTALSAANPPITPTLVVPAQDKTVPYDAPQSVTTRRDSIFPSWLPWVGGVALLLSAVTIIIVMLKPDEGPVSESSNENIEQGTFAAQTVLALSETQTSLAIEILPTSSVEVVLTEPLQPTVIEFTPSIALEASATIGTVIPTDTIVPTGLPTQISDEKGVLMALVPAGSFQMGSRDGQNDEQPVHDVYLEDFYVDVYEVTNAEYAKCVAVGSCSIPGCFNYSDPGYSNHPVICLSLYDAQNYCWWRGGRLPTEAEWEKAARGGLQGAMYPWGNEPPVCQFGARNGAQIGICSEGTVPVGSFSPNGYGLYDMVGNVWERVSSLYMDYPYDADDGRENQNSTGVRVLRGASWYSTGNVLRIANRNNLYPDDIREYDGFRCVRSP